MTFAICLLAAIGIPILAVKGRWYRGAYGAVAFIGVLFVFFALQMTGAVSQAATLEQRTGQEFINANADSAVLVGIGMVIGGLLGALLYRPAKTP